MKIFVHLTFLELFNQNIWFIISSVPKTYYLPNQDKDFIYEPEIDVWYRLKKYTDTLPSMNHKLFT